MPRAKIWGYIAVFVSILLGVFFVYTAFVYNPATKFTMLNDFTYYAIAIPIGFVSFSIIGTGFWIGFTILTIKVVPPMPEIVEKRDFSKIQAFFLCIATLGLGIMLIWGIYIKSFWALAIPAAGISLVILGAIFWVGIAIITTRSTLPENN